MLGSNLKKSLVAQTSDFLKLKKISFGATLPSPNPARPFGTNQANYKGFNYVKVNLTCFWLV
jgi:hypothetical protein